jgi:hypothetical protein
MEGPNKERWIQLSEQAAVEQDPRKLLEVVNELNALLEEKELRLAALRKTGSVPTNTRQNDRSLRNTHKRVPDCAKRGGLASFCDIGGEDSNPFMSNGDGISKNEDWRELARRIQQETDPETVLELARELIAKFNEEKLSRTLRPDEK